MYVFFNVFEKNKKNTFLLVTFGKRVLWSWKHVQKKLVIGPDIHQKYYRNRMIFQKYTTFSNSLIFFDLTVILCGDILIEISNRKAWQWGCEVYGGVFYWCKWGHSCGDCELWHWSMRKLLHCCEEIHGRRYFESRRSLEKSTLVQCLSLRWKV